jgi:hypothetical protein
MFLWYVVNGGGFVLLLWLVFDVFVCNKYEIILKRKSQDNQEFSITE